MREFHNASLAEMTTLGLGGPASRVVDVESEEELASVVLDAQANDTPLIVLGGGSNVIVDDSGWPGTVLRPALRGIDVDVDGDQVELRVGAGEVWDDMVARCVAEGWSGLACLSGIPGWIGAAPIQNIGAYGHEVGEVIVEVRAFDRQQQAFISLRRSECQFAYRSSVFRHAERHIITSVTLSLRQGRGESARYPELARNLGVEVNQAVPAHQVRAVVLELRRGKGMVVDPSDPESRSAGSFFVNPMVNEDQLEQVQQRAIQLGIIQDAAGVPRYEASPGRWKVPAAWLIERAGFGKGHTESGIGISHKHALAFVNRGGTTASLLAFERRVRDGVFDTFGVELKREPILLRADPK